MGKKNNTEYHLYRVIEPFVITQDGEHLTFTVGTLVSSALKQEFESYGVDDTHFANVVQLGREDHIVRQVGVDAEFLD